MVYVNYEYKLQKMNNDIFLTLRQHTNLWVFNISHMVFHREGCIKGLFLSLRFT